jgi:hypothetical protein
MAEVSFHHSRRSLESDARVANFATCQNFTKVDGDEIPPALTIYVANT